ETHLWAISRSRFCPAPGRRFGAPRDRLQSPGVEKRCPLGWSAVFARGSVPDAVEPDLPRRNPSQEGTPSRAARADSEPRALGEGPAALARSGCHASRTPDQGAAQPACGETVRRERRAPICARRGKRRAPLSLLCLAPIGQSVGTR